MAAQKNCIFSDYNYLKIANWILLLLSYKNSAIPTLPMYQIITFYVEEKLSLVQSYNKANIFLGLIQYELNSLLGASHLVDYISVHIRFDLERYLLIRAKKLDDKSCEGLHL